MISKVTHIPLLVRDQEEALIWYLEKLDFEKRADNPFPEGGGRWLTVAPKSQQELEIVLQPLDWELEGQGDREKLVGCGLGWVLATENCRQDYEVFRSRGVEFITSPEDTPWGVSATFQDLYGNQFNLLESR